MVNTVLLCSCLLGVQQPNIVFLVADDLGYGETGFQGNSQIPTPHLDALATSGVRCTAGYVTASYCSPSRAGLLTGRYQSRFGYERNPIGGANLEENSGLPLDEWTLADRLREQGYATGLVGKWHLGAAKIHQPQQRGFDSFWGFLHEGHYYVAGPPYENVLSFLRVRELPSGIELERSENMILSTHMSNDEPDYDADNPLYRGTEVIKKESSYLTNAITREAVALINTWEDQPYFLMVAYNAVHSPMQGELRRVKAFQKIPDVQRQIFAAMLSSLDDSVGEILKAVHQQTERPTLVAFISDNGGPTKELTSSNAPLRGGKGDLYEGGIRVPFVISWPGKLPNGLRYDQPVISMDLTATALQAAIIKPTAKNDTLPVDEFTGAATDDLPLPAKTLDGVDLVPYFVDQSRRDEPHQTLYWRLNGKTAIRFGDWKLIRPEVEGRWELYHLRSDPGETSNMADREPQLRQELMREWLALDRQMRAHDAVRASTKTP